MATLLLKDASWIVTMDEKRRILRNYSVLIEKGMIKKIAKKITESADVTLDCKDKVIMPGFINCHCHASYGHALRGLLPEGISREDYLRRLFGIQQNMDEEEEEIVSLFAMGDLLKSGYTSLLEPGTAKHTRSLVTAALKTGIRLVCGRQVLDKENPLGVTFSTTTDARKEAEYSVRRILSLENKRIRPCLATFSPTYCSKDLLQSLKAISASYKAILTMHVAEDQRSVKTFTNAIGKRPIHYLSEIGVLGPQTLLAHALFVSDEEIDNLISSNSKVAFCPSSSVRGSGAGANSRLPDLVQRGIDVGLGTDSASSSYYQDPFRVMYLCSVMFQDGRHDRSIMPPETVLEMATIRAARAVGLEAEAGSIEVGKRADLIVIRASGAEWTPNLYPPYHMVYAADKSCIETVIVDGNIVVRDGNLLSFDAEDVEVQVKRISSDLAKRSGHKFEFKWKIA